MWSSVAQRTEISICSFAIKHMSNILKPQSLVQCALCSYKSFDSTCFPWGLEVCLWCLWEFLAILDLTAHWWGQTVTPPTNLAQRSETSIILLAAAKPRLVHVEKRNSSLHSFATPLLPTHRFGDVMLGSKQLLKLCTHRVNLKAPWSLEVYSD